MSESKDSMSKRRGRPPGPPTSSGTYKQFSLDTFKSHGNHKANAHLFKVYALQEKERIHALFTRIRMRGRMDVFDSKEMRWASCCGVSFCGCNARLCEVSALFSLKKSRKKFPARKKGGGVTISSTELKIRGGGHGGVIRTSN